MRKPTPKEEAHGGEDHPGNQDGTNQNGDRQGKLRPDDLSHEQAEHQQQQDQNQGHEGATQHRGDEKRNPFGEDIGIAEAADGVGELSKDVVVGSGQGFGGVFPGIADKHVGGPGALLRDEHGKAHGGPWKGRVVERQHRPWDTQTNYQLDDLPHIVVTREGHFQAGPHNHDGGHAGPDRQAGGLHRGRAVLNQFVKHLVKKTAWRPTAPPGGS